MEIETRGNLAKAGEMKVGGKKSHRLFVASAIAGSLAWHAAAPAAAPPPAPAAAPGGSGSLVDNEAVTSNDIIVTATRTTARLENVPASILAVTGVALQTAGVTKFQDLALVAPGVQISRSGTYTQPSIRGISTSFAGGGQETNVAVYIDGIYQSDQLGTNQDLTNIQDIQILKGPQGTLYGRNATGGAILITTKSPTDTFHADANVSYGWRYNDKIGNAFVGGPVANGIKASIAASWHKSDGYFKDINSFSKNVILDSTDYTFGGHGNVNFGASANRKGNDSAPFENWSVRPKIVLEPMDSLKITLGYVHTFLNDPRGLAYDETANNTFNPGLGYRGAGDPAFNPATGANGQGTACNPATDGAICNAVTRNQRNKTSLNFRPYNQSKQDEGNGIIEWNLDDLGTITSHTAYRKQRDFQMYDLDGTPRDAGTSNNPGLPTGTTNVATAYNSIQRNYRKSFVQQLDYAGQFGGLQLLSGLFYFDDRFKSTGFEDTGSANGPTVSYLDFHTKAYAVYVDGTYNFADKLFVTAGVRYNHDEKDLATIRYTGRQTGTGTAADPTRPPGTIVAANSSGCFDNSGLTPVPLNLRQAGEPADNFAYCTAAGPTIKRNAWTPHFVVRYNLSHGTNVYASVSRGFKAGTINTGTPFNKLKPETVTAYEVGLKHARGGFRAETSAFYYDYKNNQISGFNGTTTVVSNSGGAHIYGLDQSLSYNVPDTTLNLRASAEYLHARYTNYPNATNVTLSSLKDPAGTKDNPATPANEFVAPTINAGTDLTGGNTSVIGSWTGRRLLRAPDFTASVSADYTIEDLFGGSLLTSLTAQYSGRYAPQNASYYCTYYTAVNPVSGATPVPVNQRAGDVPGQNYCDPGQSKKTGRFEENGWAQFNFAINWTDASEHFTIGVFGNNVNNVHYRIVSSQTAYGTYNMYNEPRTFGVRLGAKL